MSSVVAGGSVAFAQAAERLFAQRRDGRVGAPQRTAQVLAALGDPQQRCRRVHVTGTNGKTTVTRMVAALLSAHGRRVGAFTSPHLHHVSERVGVDGVAPTAAQFSQALEEVEAAASRLSLSLSFFETMTAVACVHFGASEVDDAVFEVGVGGRGDATNAVDASVAVIGEVALDHCGQLGADVSAIAAEKAGVVKAGATVVCGPQQPEALQVIEDRAREVQARVLRFGRDFAVRRGPGRMVAVTLPSGRVLRLRLPSAGEHQAVNAALALAAAEESLGEVDDATARRCVGDFRSAGRGELVSRSNRAAVWLDGAHNPAAARSLASVVAQWHGRGRVVLAAAMLGDKDVEPVMAVLAAAADVVVVFDCQSARAASTGRLAAAARSAGVEPLTAESAEQALDVADAVAGPDDVIVVSGSLYAVAAARGVLGVDSARSSGGADGFA